MRFFDHQVNGFAGVDFQQDAVSPAELDRALADLRRRDTRILYTLITERIDTLCKRLRHVEALRRDSRFGDVIAGYHIEGPYLLPEPGYHGAHPPELMKRPEVAELDRLCEASGNRIKLVTIAPELPGAPEFVRAAVARGVRVSIGHSAAGDADLDRAIEAGLSLCTHVGNGVPVQLHRHDNVIQRVLARDELTAAFIVDGIHIGPAALRNFVRAKPRDKVIFTSDCMSAAGAPAGRYRIGAIELEVGEDRVVRQPGKSNFAGSSATMDEVFANVQRFLGWSADEARIACCDRMVPMFGLS